MCLDTISNRDRVLTATAAILLTLIALAVAPALAGDTTTAVSTSPSPSAYGETVTFTARVKGSEPTGTVVFKAGAKKIGTGSLSSIGAQTSLSAGYYHTCALTKASAVKCWGSNAFGQLGDGTSKDRKTPVVVSGLSSEVVAIAAGSSHTCALTKAGAVWCWGNNYWGQLGDGTTEDSKTPVAVSGLSSGVVAIAAGGGFTCALTKAGAVWCWGNNHWGQLGDGTTTDRHTPVAASGLSSGVVAIAAGGNHSCALTYTGAALCWGRNDRGQLGDGTSKNRETPVAVSGLSGGVASIAGGSFHTCALTEAGAVKCWGRNHRGQLGDGTTTKHRKPVAVSGLSSGVAAIASRHHHTCVLTATGAIKCWGQNDRGQLGDGTTTERHTPTGVTGLSSGAAAIAVGRFHTCVLTATGAAKCWGHNKHAQLGDGSKTSRRTPVDVSAFGAGTVLVRAAAQFSTSELNAGAHTITARYKGDAQNATSTSPSRTHTVKKGKTKVTKIRVRPQNPVAGDTVRVVVRFKAVAPAVGDPKGKVLVKDGSRQIGTYTVRHGKAAFRLIGLKRGQHRLKIRYLGHKSWKWSAGEKLVTVR